jgi:hypothetical protein
MGSDSFPMVTLDNVSLAKMVRYVPYHADGPEDLANCEDGVITSFNEKFVFVAFRLGQQGQACKPEQLVYI